MTASDMSSPTRHRAHHFRPLPFPNGTASYLDALHAPPAPRQHANGWAGLPDLKHERPNGLSWLSSSSSWREKSHLDLSSLWRLPQRGQSPKPLRSPSSQESSVARFCFLCALWYSSSALSSNTGKSILIQFRYPVTLTIVQFAFVAAYCLLFASPLIRFTRLRRPTRSILWSTLPMGLFQVGGHMFSSMAISRIPVSAVHTIKALSPLFTVAAYAMLFNVQYSWKTYISLLPLTVGVMLACSFDVSASNSLGLICAFGSALVFVSSNIFFKKVMPSNEGGASHSHKLDKLNLLFYSSAMAFILMVPIWLFTDLPRFLSASDHVVHPSHGHASPHGVLYYFFMNGTVHFAQCILAFVILASTSPVTYSIASLVKRVAVICMAIVWFNQRTHPVQALGIGLTTVGLWMYNNAKSDVQKGENKMRRVEAARDMVLPSTLSESEVVQPSATATATAVLAAPQASYVPTTVPVHQPPPSSTLFSPPMSPPMRPRPHPTLEIKDLRIVPTKYNGIRQAVASPTDSYPSPPLSHDSPPSTSIPLAPLPDIPPISKPSGPHRRNSVRTEAPPLLERSNPIYAAA